MLCTKVPAGGTVSKLNLNVGHQMAWLTVVCAVITFLQFVEFIPALNTLNDIEIIQVLECLNALGYPSKLIFNK